MLIRSPFPALLCGALVAALPAVVASAARQDGPAVGTTAPDFTATSFVTGHATRLSAQRGKVVILTFWATWCAPCREELPDLEKIQERVGRDKLTVIAVSYRDSAETLDYVKKNAKSAAWKLTMLSDTDEAIASAYHVAMIPRLFLIGRDGKLLAIHAGYSNGAVDQFLPELNAALGITAAPPATQP